MRPKQLRRALSQYVDGELSTEETTELEDHLESSEEARGYLAQLQLLRRHLRYEPAAPTPDVTGRVLAAIQPERLRHPTRRRLSIAAAFVAGIIGGAVFIGLALRQPTQVAAADIPAQVLAAQSQVASLTARLDIIERGWHPTVPERTFSGTISYRAPESVWIEIDDTTPYPSAVWVPNDTVVVVDEDVAWTRGAAGCPTEALPDCTPPEPRLSVLTDREPFPDASAAPLDLIVPAAGFTRAGEPEFLGFRLVDQREAVGVEVTAAQVASLLEGLTDTGNWRDVHPTDRVELWLDRDALVPLALSVFPADSSDRRLWAIRRGYTDDPSVAILEVTWSEVAINQQMSSEFPPPPPGAAPPSAGFRARPASDLEEFMPRRVPEGMRIHRAGVVATESGPTVTVVSWSDGRAWLKIRSTTDWGGGWLFGDLGTLVRPVALGAGVAYLNERGDRVALHGQQVDLVVLGSLPTEVLVDLAGSLGVTGRPVPADWAEAATATLDQARAAVPGLIVPPDLQGFGLPAIRVDNDIATLAYAGPGNRGFRLAETVETELSPPLEANVRGVTVRGIEGRYSPDRGLLEWIERQLTISLTSTTLSLQELIVIAQSLAPP